MRDKWPKELDEQMLMNYLEGKLTPEEQDKVEVAMQESPFLHDSDNGTSIITNKQSAAVILAELNRDLSRKTNSGQEKIKYNQLIPNVKTLITIASIIILLLVIIGFVLFKMLQSS